MDFLVLQLYNFLHSFLHHVCFSKTKPVQNFKEANTTYPTSAPSVFINTSSSWQYPRSDISCTVSIPTLMRNPNSTVNFSQPIFFLRSGFLSVVETASGYNIPNGTNNSIFSMTNACACGVSPQVPNNVMSIPCLDPGSLDRKTVTNITARYTPSRNHTIEFHM